MPVTACLFPKTPFVGRLSIDEYGCLLTLVGKARSEDPHTRCSAVGTRADKSIIGISYNGLSRGMSVPAWMNEEENRAKKGEFFIHAEDNLFRFVHGDECHALYLNISPCAACSKLIVAQGVRRVVYLKEYHRCNKFKEIFAFHGIIYEELSSVSKRNIKAYLDNLNNFEELN